VAVVDGQFHNLGACPLKSLSQVSQRAVFSHRHGTARTIRAEFLLGVWAIKDCVTVHVTRVQCEVGIKCLFCTEKREGPTPVTQNHGHEFLINTKK
jgi:hypothetical protein